MTITYIFIQNKYDDPTSLKIMLNMLIIMFRVEAQNSILIKTTGVKVTTPANLPQGKYNISCNMTGKIVSNAVAVGELTLVDMASMTISSVLPAVTKAATGATLVVSGTFVNTPELQVRDIVSWICSFLT